MLVLVTLKDFIVSFSESIGGCNRHITISISMDQFIHPWKQLVEQGFVIATKENLPTQSGLTDSENST